MAKVSAIGDRMEAYGAKMKAGSDYVAPITAEKLALMKRKMRAEGAYQEQYSLSTKYQLDAAGVSVVLYPFYLAFAGEVARIVQRLGGEVAAVAVETNIVKWVARGMTRSVMEDIRTSVFNVQPPATP